MDDSEKTPDLNPLIGGALNIFGLKIDLGDLLANPEGLKTRLEELREKLKAAGGAEMLSDGAWQQGGVTVSGHIRTRGLAGDREFHVGTMGKPGGKSNSRPSPQPPDVVEPPVDVFDEGEQVIIVADVPGVGLEDMELKVEGSVFSLATKPNAHRGYRKTLRLAKEVTPESLEATCRNGVLEVHLRQRKA